VSDGGAEGGALLVSLMRISLPVRGRVLVELEVLIIGIPPAGVAHPQNLGLQGVNPSPLLGRRLGGERVLGPARRVHNLKVISLDW